MDSTILSLGRDSLKFWDLKSSKPISTHKITGISDISRAVFSPRGDALAAVGKTEEASFIYLVDISKKGLMGGEMNIFYGDSSREKIPWMDVAYNNVASLIACGAGTGQVDLFSCKTSNIVKTFPARDGNLPRLSTLLFSVDDSLILSGDAGGNVNLYSMQDGDRGGIIKTMKQGINRLRITSLGDNIICSVHCGGAVCLSDLETAQVIHSFSAHLADCQDITFSSVNPYTAVSVGRDNRIIFYDMREKTIMKNQITTDSSLTSALFLPSGADLLCGTATGKILCYDLRAGSVPRNIIVAHSSPVSCLALRPLRKERAILETHSVVLPSQKHSPVIDRRGSEQLHGSKEAILNLSSSSTKSTKSAIPSSTAKKSEGITRNAVSSVGNSGLKQPVKSKEKGQGDGFLVPAIPPPKTLPLLKINGIDMDYTVLNIEKDREDATVIGNGADIINSKDSPDVMNVATKAMADAIILETRITGLEVQDIVYDYGSWIKKRVWDLQDEVKMLREDVKQLSTVQQAILLELRTIRNRMPY